MLIGGQQRSQPSREAWQGPGLRHEMGGLFGEPAHTGELVTRRNALGIAAFYSCIRLLSTSTSILPLSVRNRSKPSKVESTSDVAIRLRDQPNAEACGAVLWGTAAQHLGTAGNAYGLKLPPSDGLDVPEIYLAVPDQSRPYYGDDGRLWYDLVSPSGMMLKVRGEHVLHFKGIGLDGTLVGHNPIALQRHHLGVALSAQEHQARTLTNDGTPGGVLSVEESLDAEQARTIREQWHSMHSGPRNSGKIAVLDRGAKYQQISMSHADAQFIEQRELSASEIAGYHAIPASMINARGASFEYKNVNDRRMDYLTFALMPFLSFIEGPLNADPDFFGLRSPWEPRFSTKEFLRPDAPQRYKMHRDAIEAEWMDADEVRKEEGLPSRSDGATGEASPGRATDDAA